MSQTVNFMAPIYIDEEIEATVEVKSINSIKGGHIVLNTTIKKVLMEKIAVNGEARILYKINKT